MHHSKCAKYFDNETSAFIRYGKKEFIYDHFGCLSCCGGREQRNKVMFPPPLTDGSNNVKHDTQPSIVSSLNESSHQMVNVTFLESMKDKVSDINYLFHLHLCHFCCIYSSTSGERSMNHGIVLMLWLRNER
mmetsp:Transcript_26639/g.54475  ORF Transcript_26639/g.54475 Transcript_26639/m.54475 type:complete len:132 (-) Transcript_26639:40-435(-)